MPMNREEDFDTSEQKCWELLQDFIENSDFKTKIKIYGRKEKCDYVDATGMTTSNQFLNMELKRRYHTLGKFDTLYAEGHKVADLYVDYFCLNKIPLYINFLDDGYVVIYNLTRLKHRHEAVKGKNWSQGYKAFEMTQSQRLDLKDAYIYKKENNRYKHISKKGS